jgi:hypothetical protein
MKTARRSEPLFLFLFARSKRRLPTRRRAFLAGRGEHLLAIYHALDFPLQVP